MTLAAVGVSVKSDRPIGAVVLDRDDQRRPSGNRRFLSVDPDIGRRRAGKRYVPPAGDVRSRDGVEILDTGAVLLRIRCCISNIRGGQR
jgi:hypothetical protein